jgi:glycosyltransferase involved in cell wall biosynthesis
VSLKVVRVYHAGRDDAHRERDRALVRAGVDVTLVVPQVWPGAPAELAAESFEIVELPLLRPGNVNRCRLANPDDLIAIVDRVHPDIVDLHEEPFSAITHQILRRLPSTQRVVTYTAQNLDKRFPPPFSSWERQALGRIQGIYPCSNQAASVVVGKGFAGEVAVLPLAPPSFFTVGDQTPPDDEIRMLLVGRLVGEKGVLDAVRVLSGINEHRRATLTVVGDGPEADAVQTLADQLGVLDALELHPWVAADELLGHYQQAHFLLTPSRGTRTWVEQFGRMVVEAHASGAVVVGYDSGSLPEVVGEAGRLVREGDVDALTQAVLDVAGDPARWTALRAAGFQRA